MSSLPRRLPPVPPTRPGHGQGGTYQTRYERVSGLWVDCYRVDGYWRSLLAIDVVALTVRFIGRVGVQGVADGAVVPFLAFQPETGLVARPLHDERQRDGLLAVVGVVAVDL